MWRFLRKSCRESALKKRGFSSDGCVIIGGGVAGTSLSWMLAQKGIPVTLLEKSNFLCAGATWHAAGLVTRFAGSPKLKKIHVRSLALLNELHETTEGGISLHTPGSIRIIPKGDHDRFMEAKQHIAMAKLYDDPLYPTSLISPEEIEALHYLVDVNDVECGVYTPNDGDIDPTSLVTCISAKAKSLGADYRTKAHVDRVERHSSGGFTVHTSDGQSFSCAMLVNAAGLWSKHITQMVDDGDDVLQHQAFIIEHQYAVTDSIPSIVEAMKAGGESARLPVLRDLKGSSYIRQETNGLLVGPYELNCRMAPPEWVQGPPPTFEFDLFESRMDEIEDNLCSGMELIPALGEVGFKNCTNGPTIWTADSLPRCGRTRIPGYYDFNTLTYGIAQGLPLAEYLAHIMVEGEQPFDMAAQCDPLRYGSWASDAVITDIVRDSYSKNNACSYAFENRKAGREHLKTRNDPLYQALKDHGAWFGFSNGGVETPSFFPSPKVLTNMNECKLSHMDWADTVLTEAKSVISNVGIAHASFGKILVNGPKARGFLDFLTTGVIPSKPGPTRLTYATTKTGNVLAEFSVANIGPDKFYLICSRDYVAHDHQWLLDQSKDPRWEGGVDVQNISDDIDILHLAGPRSRILLASICPEISDLKFLHFQDCSIAGVELRCFRVSFSGNHGFELHCASGSDVATVYSAIMNSEKAIELGLIHFGGLALNSLRMEKGFKLKADLDYAHYTEAGIDQFISKKKMKAGHGAFLGQDSSYVRTRRAAMFKVHTEPGYEWSVVSDSPIIDRNTGQVVGFTTSATAAPETGHTVAMGFMKLADCEKELVNSSSDLYIEAFDQVWDVDELSAPPASVIGRLAWEDVEF